MSCVSVTDPYPGMFLDLLDPDPDPTGRGTEPAPAPDPSIIKQK
jgi:hypothetical protein